MEKVDQIEQIEHIRNWNPKTHKNKTQKKKKTYHKIAEQRKQ